MLIVDRHELNFIVDSSPIPIGIEGFITEYKIIYTDNTIHIITNESTNFKVAQIISMLRNETFQVKVFTFDENGETGSQENYIIFNGVKIRHAQCTMTYDVGLSKYDIILEFRDFNFEKVAIGDV